MKKSAVQIFLYFSFFSSWAQADDVALTFQDSVRVSLGKIKSTEATSIGDAFGEVWMSLGNDQQLMIQEQTKLMIKKRYPTNPHLINYFGAIVVAVTTEKMDVNKLSSFLSVVSQTIKRENAAIANYSFQLARGFFEHHALRYENFFKLYTADDEYSFDFLINQTDTTAAKQEVNVNSVLSSLQQWKKSTNQPEIIGPVIIFNKLKLNFVTPFDSVVLKNTSGVFSLRDRVFAGVGGSFDWSPAGLSADSVYYEFDKYSFKATDPVLSAAQGKLVYIGKVADKVPGSFQFRSVKHKTKNESGFPRFKSYGNNISILGLSDKNFVCSGGFNLEGSVITSVSAGNKPATIEVLDEANKKFIAESKLFFFRDSSILANDARVVIFHGNDSIVHPSMGLQYNYGKQKLRLDKSKTALHRAPFTSSYFRIDFTADALDWDLKSDSIDLSIYGSGTAAPLIIESQDFYDPYDFRQLRNAGFDFNPLALVVKYAKTNGVTDFSYNNLISEKIPNNSVRMAADFLSQKGMIDYNAQTGTIHVKQKAFHFLEASQNKADYDNVKIHSLIDTVANATINLKKNQMTVRGIEEFKVSDSLNVIVKPSSNSVTFLRNRDMKFKGTIEAGNFEITGRDFTLKYDSFYVNLNHIDSIRFYVTEKDGTRRRVKNSVVRSDSTDAVKFYVDEKNGGRKQVNHSLVRSDSTAVATGLQPSIKSSGILFINRPDNRAGKVKYPNYPRLDAKAGGVIYFDKKEILNGVYDRSVFFVAPPFKIDSLNNADPALINFDGEFVSNGMLPKFKEKLHAMRDKSLGFTHTIPSSGYTMYNTNAKLFGGLNMDNGGLRAAGKIQYQAASVESSDFILYPDSALAKGNKGEIMEKQIGAVGFPQASLKDYQMKWYPQIDKLKIKNLKEPFSLYHNTATIKGNLTVSKAGVTGSGWLNTRGSEVISRDFGFSSKDFSARHAHFEVKTGNPDKPALAAKDVRVKFDLAKNTATISPEREGVAAIDFPYAQFKTSIPEATWDLTTKKIVMTKAPDVPLENSYFYTTRKELDSLHFNAERAEYDIQSQYLKVSGIPYIKVADAKITPENNEVLILENAKIGQLKNTTIVLDTINGYHQLKNGVVDILSRKEFSGSATYEYVNAVNDTFSIKMTDFHLEAIAEDAKKKGKRNVISQTVANGAVTDKDKILIAPRIYYKGDMVMYATKPALELNGFIKLDLKKIKYYNTWIAYNQSGDEKEIYLDFDHSVTEFGGKVRAGLHFSVTNDLYITFVSDKKDEADEDFFLPSGSLFFDKESGEFKIENRKKSSGASLEGKIFNYNEDKQEIKFEGPVNFFKGNNDFKLSASSIGSGNIESNEIKMNSLVLATINIPEAAYQMMATNLQEATKYQNLEPGLGDEAELLYKIANLVGEKIARGYEQKSQKGYTSLATIPQLVANIGFANVNFKWSKGNKAFYNDGELGVSHIGKSDINASFEGFMEIRKGEDGSPITHVFIKAAPNAWYYFGYEDNQLMVHSSNELFNDLIAKKSNAGRAKVGELVLVSGSNEETLAWINKFRHQYYKSNSPYDLEGDVNTPKKKSKKVSDKIENDGF